MATGVVAATTACWLPDELLPGGCTLLRTGAVEACEDAGACDVVTAAGASTMMNVYGSAGRCGCGGWWPSLDTTYVGQGAVLGSRESTTHSFLSGGGWALSTPSAVAMAARVVSHRRSSRNRPLPICRRPNVHRAAGLGWCDT